MITLATLIFYFDLMSFSKNQLWSSAIFGHNGFFSEDTHLFCIMPSMALVIPHRHGRGVVPALPFHYRSSYYALAYIGVKSKGCRWTKRREHVCSLALPFLLFF